VHLHAEFLRFTGELKQSVEPRPSKESKNNAGDISKAVQHQEADQVRISSN